jgi:hypothetical protein
MPLALGLGLTLALLWVLGAQSPSAVAAPYAPQSGGDWDGLSVGAPMVISDAGTYRMWYQGRGASFLPGVGGYAPWGMPNPRTA